MHLHDGCIRQDDTTTTVVAYRVYVQQLLGLGLYGLAARDKLRLEVKDVSDGCERLIHASKTRLELGQGSEE
jgi:hypothetical protein